MPRVQPRRRRVFGAVRKLPSGRYQASYVGPDGVRHIAPETFDTNSAADNWLAAQQTDIGREEWRRPQPVRPAMPTLREYAAGWLAQRRFAH